MGNKRIIKEIFAKIGWWIYWKSKWQKNKEWKENFSPNSILGKQIRDNRENLSPTQDINSGE